MPDTLDPKTASPFASWNPNHSAILVGDLDEAIEWYGKHFDFKLKNRWVQGEKEFGWMTPAENGEFIIEMLAYVDKGKDPAHALKEDTDGIFRHHTGFHVENVDKTVAELKSRGVTVVSEAHDVEGAGSRVAFFIDAWGNLFEITEAIQK